MKILINNIHLLRNKLFTAKQYDSSLHINYFFRNVLGFIRGLLVSLSGKVKIDSAVRRKLILGMNTKLIIRPGCALVLIGDDVQKLSDTFYNNPFFPFGSTVGLAPYYIALDPPVNSNTRIDLDNNSKLILDKNTTILSGCYISANHGAEIFIGENSYISHEVIINSREKVFIGKNVLLGQKTRIMDFDAHNIYLNDALVSQPINHQAAVIIEDDVWTGFQTTILKGVRIGRGSIIGANSCVTSDVPANSIAVGNPARIIRENIKWER